VLEFDMEQQSAGYPQVLDEMVAAGYSGTELGDWGFMPTDTAALSRELQERGLALLGAFVPVPLRDAAAHATGEETALRTARLMAAVAAARAGAPGPFIVLADDNGGDQTRVRLAGRIRPEHGLDAGQWRVAAAGAERIARAVAEQTGLRTVFHHHCGGYVETPAEIDALLERTDERLLGLCFDTGHYTFGGGDALEGLRRYGARVWHVHLKDCQPSAATGPGGELRDYFEAVRHGVFCELGRGVVDFPAIMAELKARGYDGWAVVEQDVLPGMGTPLASARRNREYLASLGL
jgi:inosose dehydratase